MLFDRNKALGIFVGLAEDGLNFGAEITLNYDSDFQSKPMLGVYVIIQLGNPSEVVLGRITAVSSHGKLASTAGEDIGARTIRQGREMPEDIKRDFLRYKCSVRLLGLLHEVAGGKTIFTPSARRLPHMGAGVAFADGEVLQVAAGAKRIGAPIGFLAYGEFIYASGHKDAKQFPPNFHLLGPIVEPRFDAADAMVARRTAVLARSGFGKSNLLKILFTRLYENGPPQLEFAHGGRRPVGTLVFDPDGDYFWPGAGANSPPGLCDIAALQDQILLATDRPGPTPYHQSFVVSSAKLDLRVVPPAMVLACSLTSDRQTHRGTEAMQRLSMADWAALLDAAWCDLNGTPGTLSIPLIQQSCRLGTATSTEVQAGGIRNTLLDLVAKLHEPTSRLVSVVERGLRDGKMVIVDLSLMRGQPATSTAAILLRYIFEYNVREHTRANGTPYAVITLIEEAQKVLEGKETSHGPFIEWVKEGRKYGLGSVLVTQQPGAIDDEILSQTDSFFAFHLLSSSDLNALAKANGHFSDDILATLLNEPIEGQGAFWSSAGKDKTTYPIPFRAFNFGDLFQRLPASATGTAPASYASRIANSVTPGSAPNAAGLPQPSATFGKRFPNKAMLKNADSTNAQKLAADLTMAATLSRQDFPLFAIQNWLRDVAQRKTGLQAAAIAVVTVLYGLYGVGWVLENRAKRNGGTYEVVRKLDPRDGLARLDANEDPVLPDEGDAAAEESTGPDDPNADSA